MQASQPRRFDKRDITSVYSVEQLNMMGKAHVEKGGVQKCTCISKQRMDSSLFRNKLVFAFDIVVLTVKCIWHPPIM